MSQQRFVTNSDGSLADQLMSPRHPLRVNHRGWEVRTDQVCVFANGSLDDARFASQEFNRGWRQAGRVADHFSRRHRAAGFGANSTLLFVDRFGAAEGRKSQSYAVGSQFVIQVRVAKSGQSQLSERSEMARQIHTAASRSFLHSQGATTQLPQWFQDDFADYIHLVCRRDKAFANGVSFSSAKSRNRVQFLLEGDGGEHAWRTFDALSKDGRSAQQELAGLWRRVSRQYQHWLEGSQQQPQLVRASQQAEGLPQLQSDLYTLIRLAKRWSAESPPDQAHKNVRIVEFANGVASPQQSTASEPSADFDMTQFQSRLLSTPWSIHLPRGGWLDQRVAGKLANRLELSQRRVEVKRQAKHWRVTYQWDSEHLLVGTWATADGDAGRIQFAVHRKKSQPTKAIGKKGEPTARLRTGVNY